MATHRTTAGVPVDEPDQPAPYPGPQPGESNARAVRLPSTTAEPTSPGKQPVETEIDVANKSPVAPKKTRAVKKAEAQRKTRVGRHR